MEHIGKYTQIDRIKARVNAYSQHPLGIGQMPAGKGGRFYIFNEFATKMMKNIKKIYGLAMVSHITRIYVVLVKHVGKEGTCFPSQKTIMDLACISNKNTLGRAFKIMESLKLIVRKPERGRNHPTIYIIVHRRHWVIPSDLPPENVSKPP